MKRWCLAVVVTSSALAACGAGSESSGGVRVQVQRTALPSRVAAMAPRSGQRFVQVGVELANESATGGVFTNPQYFSVQTPANMLFVASVYTAGVSGGCSPTVGASVGGRVACELVFEVPSSVEQFTLRYDDTQGHRAETSLQLAGGSSDACNGWGSTHPHQSATCEMCVAASCGAITVSRQCASVVYDYVHCIDDGGGPCACLARLNAECRASVGELVACTANGCASVCVPP